MACNRCGIRKKSASRSRRGSSHSAQAVSTAILSNLGQGYFGERWLVLTQSKFAPFYEGVFETSQHSFPSHRSTHPSAGYEERASSLKSRDTEQLASERAISILTPSTTTNSGDGDLGEVIGNAAQFGQPSPANADFALQGIDDSSHFPKGYGSSSPIDRAAVNDYLHESAHLLEDARWDPSSWTPPPNGPPSFSIQDPWNGYSLPHLDNSSVIDVIEEGPVFREKYALKSGNPEPLQNINRWTPNTDQDWIRAQHGSVDAQLQWQKASSQISYAKRENPNYHNYPPASPTSFCSPSSSTQAATSKAGIRTGPLTDSGRANARIMRLQGTCLRCFFMKERCIMEHDGICERCRNLGNKLRTWDLPCSRVGLDQRAKYLLPEVLVTQLKADRVTQFVKDHVSGCVAGSSIKVVLTLGSGTPLRFDGVEAIARDEHATRMFSFRVNEDGSITRTPLESPAILPYMADRYLIHKAVNHWIDSMIRECDSPFLQNYLPEPDEQWEKEILTIICQYHRDHILQLEPSGEGPYQTLRWALKMTALNFIMGRPLVVPEDEVKALALQLRHHQIKTTSDWVCPRLTNRIIKHMLLPMLKQAVNRVLSDLSNPTMLRAKGDEEGVWDQAFCVMFLCLLVVGKTQASLIERAEVGKENDDRSFSLQDAISAIDEMESELSKHLIFLFHCRFGTTKTGTGKGKAFNPLARDARLRQGFTSSLAEQVRSATNIYGSKIRELSDLRQQGHSSKGKTHVTCLLARFMQPFFQNSG